ncbi:MAG: CDP-diacylglycerol--glycerol-3-phosphate 3-phosphatidyltransferase [Sphaerochaetaceae bacterium]|jgi:CDP-diacylglycerol--glycerol-3-phosphate 3-phosphatidyltransferase|nr:CDP-diacylglycerol--glycerol-3-phosphate 3-phosphatidyltransferase [Sphaerochaetaceae bacterium]NLO60075.1 CDP-diacylglycerol--glycerol-3-phosphate 3-phosphatidyltransferase [Spirochaetales bacterium]MDD2406201.1 CDP-diacylglycerol--glycerol-3-phosphate 3-phosphatidyltransferase [Sphaerochaetaceae bacterium]MDD4258521.1 CDP-diacylglycerol--glycerol-3-phosphate 3-phosphatidyltransferase [Sphaerochaetaceae bacterium]MDD4762840.1 CDP-diacylglycerol--glycerol-3-phosphate 3-phosphatidyltransferas
MNLPNKLTVSRMVMAPLLFIAFMLPEWGGEQLKTFSVIVTLILFGCTELTDLLDGIIARKWNMVTDLGKVMDPFADTFSRLTYFVCLSHASIMPVWAFVIIMWREFSIVFVRMLMMGKGVAVPANIWGKSKAVLYAISAIVGFLFIALDHWAPSSSFIASFEIVLIVVFGLAAFASLASFGTYIQAIIKGKFLSKMSR